MPDCELRKASASDTDTVYRLITELKQTEYDRQRFAESFRRNLQNPSYHYQLAFLNGEAVGLIGMQIQFPLNQNHWTGEVQELVVAPQSRGQRVGQALLAWAEHTARQQGASVMELSSNKVRTDAHRFYRREGYQQSHFRFKKVL